MALQGMLARGGIDMEANVHREKVTVTNAQLKALAGTPKTLVTAKGSNRFVEFVGAILRLNAGTNVLTESADNLVIRYTDGSGTIVSETIEMTGFVDQASDMATIAIPKLDVIVSEANCVNKPLVLHNSGSGDFAGNAAADATLEVTIMYRVHKFRTL